MFSDYGKELLKNGIIEAKAGHKEAARRYLDRSVYSSNDHDVLAEAWFWMSEVVEDSTEKRKALENCLAHDLQHARARHASTLANRSGSENSPNAPPVCMNRMFWPEPQ